MLTKIFEHSKTSLISISKVFVWLYDFAIYKHYRASLLFIMFAFVVLNIFAFNLQVDASGDTLVIDGDKDYKYFQKVSKDYNDVSDTLIMVYEPKTYMLSNQSIKLLQAITNKLQKLEYVDNVMSILNVPLLKSSHASLEQLLSGNVPILLSNGIDKKLAKKEFLSNAVYKQNLVSYDFRASAILITLKPHLSNTQSHMVLEQIKSIIKKHKNNANLVLGGVSMLVDYLIESIKFDLAFFGFVVFIMMVFMLYLFFRNIIFVLLPIIIAVFSFVVTSSIISLLDIKITVISSNFVSFLLIVSISLTLHLIVKIKELANDNSLEYAQKIKTTMNSMFSPMVFVVITTIAGFSSLIFSNILPVMSFGFIMIIGIIVCVISLYLLFPTILLMFKSNITPIPSKNIATANLSYFVEKYPKTIFTFSVVVVVLGIMCSTKLVVENSFINYFKSNSPIYKGLKQIDDKLGGTTPLDIIIQFDKDKAYIEQVSEVSTTTQFPNSTDKSEDIEQEEFDYEDEIEQGDNIKQANIGAYWFDDDKLDAIKKVHNYLQNQPFIGKVLSLHSLILVAEDFNDGEKLTPFEVGVLYSKIPPKYKQTLVEPYLNIQNNEARIRVRIKDSSPKLRRDELISSIKNDLNKILEVDKSPKSYKLSNLLILYNNMLQSLFSSQIKTLFFVVIILFGVFLLLFRNYKVACIAVAVNLVPLSALFGLMGVLHIPLDIMSITIAAIALGIGIDDAIHYLHRYNFELSKNDSYIEGMQKAHANTGVAMLNTSVVISVGFLALLFSSFVPTIYFGLLISFCIMVAMVCNLVLLPALLIHFKPFKK